MYNLNLYLVCQNRPISRRRAKELRRTGSLRERRRLPGAKLCRNGVELAERASRYNFFVFPNKKRFPRALFPSALKTGRRFSSPHLSIIVPKTGIPPLSAQGYAVVIPKKIAHLSVERHKIKRRILEALRTLPLTGQSLPPALIVFPKSSVSSVSYKDIQIELASLLSKIQQ